MTAVRTVDPFDDARASASRAAREHVWLALTRRTLPALAARCGWSIRHDHCFQRILLDHAVGGCWYDQIAGRPAYRFIGDDALCVAILLGERIVTGDVDVESLDRQSLAWRAAARARRVGQPPVSDDLRTTVSPSAASTG